MFIERAVSAVTSTVRGLGFVCCVLFCLDAAAVERATAVLQQVSGNPAIFELSNGEPRHASFVVAGRSYSLPIEIETGTADSATFALTNSVIEVSPNSLMRIVAPEGQATSVVQRVWQEAGSSLFRVQRGTIERFQVETPFLVSVVKGTVFNVLVREDGATVSLQEGRLQVNSIDSRQTVDLTPGDVAFAGRDGVLRLLEVELTDSGAKARETLAANVVQSSDAPIVDLRTGAALPLVNVPTPSVEVPDLNGVGKSIAGVEPVVATVVPPVVDNVGAPVVGDVVAPVVANVVVPVMDNVVAPVIDNVVAPVVDNVVAPVIDNVVEPVVDSVVAPIVADVVAPVVDDVVAPLLDDVVAPIVEPLLDDVVDPLVGEVVDPLIDPLLDDVVDPLLDPLADVTGPLLDPLDPLTDPLLGDGSLVGGLLDGPSGGGGGGGGGGLSGLLRGLF